MPTPSPLSLPLVYTSPLASYFDFEHLPPHLQEVSADYCRLALGAARALNTELYLYGQKLREQLLELAAGDQERAIINEQPTAAFVVLANLPPNLRAALNQTEAAIARLLEAKDCAVRAALSLVKAAKAKEQVPEPTRCEYHLGPLPCPVAGCHFSVTKPGT